MNIQKCYTSLVRESVLQGQLAYLVVARIAPLHLRITDHTYCRTDECTPSALQLPWIRFLHIRWLLTIFLAHMNIKDGRSWLVAIERRRGCVSRNHSHVRIFLSSSVCGLLTKTFQDFASALCIQSERGTLNIWAGVLTPFAYSEIPHIVTHWLARRTEFDTNFCHLNFTLVWKGKSEAN